MLYYTKCSFKFLYFIVPYRPRAFCGKFDEKMYRYCNFKID